MSKSDGRVTMTCKIPGLGTVSGYRTLKEIVDGSADASDDGPAVTYKDLGDDAREATAESSGDSDSSGSASTSDDSDSAERSADVTSTGDASSSDDGQETSDEDKAEALFKLARTYIMSGHGEMGKKKLRELIRLYPDTSSARRAKRLLNR